MLSRFSNVGDINVFRTPASSQNGGALAASWLGSAASLAASLARSSLWFFEKHDDAKHHKKATILHRSDPPPRQDSRELEEVINHVKTKGRD